MNPWGEQMKARSKQFALDVIRLCRGLHRSPEIDTIRRQLVDAATSASDNYRSACRARTHAEFTARMGTVLDEADESESWLNALHDADLHRSPELDRLRREAGELRAIFARSTKTANDNERHGRRSRER